jgi:glutamyl-tRNA reductase
LHPNLTDTDLPETELSDAQVDRARPAVERLVVLAGTFRDLPTDRREQLAERLASLRNGLAERLLLHTCHRAELIAVLEPGMSADGVGVSGWRGADAVERVFTVAAGLDSAIAGEEQLLGQVRETYRSALAAGETGPLLNELLRRALRFGKRVRAAALPTGDRSLAGRSLEWLAAHPLPVDGEILVVGTGTVARELVSGLAARGFRCAIASRNVERAEALIATLPDAESDRRHRAIPLTDALEAGQRWAAVAFATRTADPLLQRDLGGLVIDLCAPAAVAQPLHAALGDRLLDLDSLGAGARPTFSPGVERRLRQELLDERDAYLAWLSERRSADGIAQLQRHAGSLVERHLDRLRGRTDLRDDQLAEVQRMTRAVVAELLHAPTLHLRNADDAAAEVRRLFGLAEPDPTDR